MSIAEVNGIRLYFEQNDFTPFWEPERPPVLFVHGLGVDHTIWKYQVPSFAQRRPVITIDTRGHGRSINSGSDDFTIEEHADDIAALLRKLGSRPAHLVGTSIGGLIVQQLAVRHPDQVQSIVAIGTFCDGPADPDPTERYRAFDAIEDLETYYQRIVSELFGRHGTQQMVDDIVQLEIHTPRSVLRKGLGIYAGYRGGEIAASIRKPALVIVGELESWVENKKRLASVIPGAEIQVFPQVAHNPYQEIPDEFNRVVSDFINKHDVDERVEALVGDQQAVIARG